MPKRDLPATDTSEPLAKKAKPSDGDGGSAAAVPDPEKTAAMIEEKKREIAQRIQKMREAKAAAQSTTKVAATTGTFSGVSNPLIPRAQFATVKVRWSIIHFGLMPSIGQHENCSERRFTVTARIQKSCSFLLLVSFRL